MGCCLATLRQHCPDVASIVEVWDDLPAVVRAGIVAMVRTVQR